MSNIVPYADIEKMATAVAASKLFGVKNPQEAIALMLVAQAEGMHPATAARDYHVIQGRPALKADAMLARFQQAGGAVKWKEYTNEVVTGIFSHPQGGELEVTWTLAQAKSIGIANKDNWRNYPRAMLRARVISEGIRSVYPGCVVGVYTPEEVQDFTPAKEVKDMGVAERVDEVIHTAMQEVEDDGAYRLHLPGQSEHHSSYHTQDEWIAGYAALVSAVMRSTKHTDAEKVDKLKRLAEANEKVVQGFDSFGKAKLKAEIVKAGGTVSPKSELSQPAQTLPPSEEESLNI